MKESLKPGLEHELRFVVTASKTVPALYPESPDFQAMPAVFATGYLVGFLEWACLLVAKPHLDPGEQTVGTRVAVSHEAATPPGLVVTARAKLVGVDGRKLRFEVEADDGVDLIARGTHERAVIVRATFDTRLAAKASGQGV
ncbi:Fluoroacetyl-CoA thioesterase [Burkholderiales bacterium]|nr:Fluoroacetyl-CoA thioesterase [Burkholderiales bacterium]